MIERLKFIFNIKYVCPLFLTLSPCKSHKCLNLPLAISEIKLELSHIIIISVISPRHNLWPCVAPPWTSQKLLVSDNYLSFVFNSIIFKIISSVKLLLYIPLLSATLMTLLVLRRLIQLQLLKIKYVIKLFVLFYMKWLFWKLGRTKAYELKLFGMLNTSILPIINKRKIWKDIEKNMKLTHFL